MGDVLASGEVLEEPSDYGDLRPGTRLGRYELLVPIARGGMARVWAARLHGQRGFQKLVAIKVILPHLAEEAEFERMFLDEARIASGVHHSNVCEIYELGEEKKTLYLAMEWVSGDSFARVLRASGRTEAIDPRVVARIVADACAGVHAAHELTDDDGRALGVVHRDLSPHNILLTADGTAKVCDFGVAKALGQLHEATSAGQLKGKIAYMAPEQITGSAVDRRSDVFSLGCVLYEATTGARPFRGESDPQVMHAILKGEITAPTALIRSYPKDLEKIVLRALSPQALARYPTAERMRFALEEYLTRGQLVTQANVAHVMRARIGNLIDRRKERIRQASTAGDGEAGWSEPPASMSNDPRGGDRSGVKSSKPGSYPDAAPLSRIPPARASAPSSSTIPQAARFGNPSFIGPTPIPYTEGTGSLAPPAPASHPPPRAGSGPPPLAGGSQPDMFASGGASRHSSSGGAVGAGQYALAIAIGILLAGLIGAGGLWWWKSRPAPVATAEGAAKNPLPSAVAGGAGAPIAASAEISFRVTPGDATLFVDGRPLLGTVRSVPRPAVGRTANVVARAKGYEDVTVLVDFFTASPLDVRLKVVDAVSARPAPSTSTAFEIKDSPKDAPKEAPKEVPKRPIRPAPKDPDVPANPY